MTNVKSYRWCHSAASLPTKRDMLCIIEMNGASSLIAHLLDSVHAASRGTLGGGGGGTSQTCHTCTKVLQKFYLIDVMDLLLSFHVPSHPRLMRRICGGRCLSLNGENC
jgi:hypothetical protein